MMLSLRFASKVQRKKNKLKCYALNKILMTVVKEIRK